MQSSPKKHIKNVKKIHKTLDTHVNRWCCCTAIIICCCCGVSCTGGAGAACASICASNSAKETAFTFGFAAKQQKISRFSLISMKMTLFLVCLLHGDDDAVARNRWIASGSCFAANWKYYEKFEFFLNKNEVLYVMVVSLLCSVCLIYSQFHH